MHTELSLSFDKLNMRRRTRHIHLIGIGGAGMSGIAEVLLTQGYQVTGSDLSLSPNVERLKGLGATVYREHKADNIAAADVVVVSSAIAQDNPELVASRLARIPVVSRAEMLAELMRFRYGVAIAGAHGKTTTTSLCASLLAEGGLDPTYVIGGVLNQSGCHGRLGAGPILVAEADESDASFLSLKPMMAVVTNIDNDHLSNYGGSFEKLKQSFLDFLHHLPFYGLAVLCIDDPVICELLDKVNRPFVTYGFSNAADFKVCAYQQSGIKATFNLLHGDKQSSFVLNMPGKHNVLNAVAAIAVATEFGVSENAIASALNKFSGIGRRFHIYGEYDFLGGQVTLIDDYGHHPRELSATLDAIRQVWPERRLVTVFQPHRYSRTNDLFEDFTKVLSDVDVLLLLEVYSAGEKVISGADSRALAGNIRRRGRVDPIFVDDSDRLLEVIHTVLRPGDILLLQGAGDIGKIAAKFAKAELQFS